MAANVEEWYGSTNEIFLKAWPLVLCLYQNLVLTWLKLIPGMFLKSAKWDRLRCYLTIFVQPLFVCVSSLIWCLSGLMWMAVLRMRTFHLLSLGRFFGIAMWMASISRTSALPAAGAFGRNLFGLEPGLRLHGRLVLCRRVSAAMAGKGAMAGPGWVL